MPDSQVLFSHVANRLLEELAGDFPPPSPGSLPDMLYVRGVDPPRTLGGPLITQPALFPCQSRLDPHFFNLP